jgi:hypothetical protein
MRAPRERGGRLSGVLGAFSMFAIEGLVIVAFVVVALLVSTLMLALL